jgi:hypothetical protein
MASAKYNMQVLKRSRTRPKAGDIFVIRPIKHDYYFGRVINPKVDLLAFQGILAYVYDIHARDKEPPAALPQTRLLIPPLLLDYSCWTLGLAERVEQRELSAADVLPKHCFYNILFRRYSDEHGTILEKKIEPCGEYGVTLPRGLGSEVSKALKIPFDDEQ